jgi:hypothetical protein
VGAMAVGSGVAVARQWDQHDDDAEIAAVLLEQDGHQAGWINTRLVTSDLTTHVQRWADRELARGKRCIILYADELASLG